MKNSQINELKKLTLGTIFTLDTDYNNQVTIKNLATSETVTTNDFKLALDMIKQIKDDKK